VPGASARLALFPDIRNPLVGERSLVKPVRSCIALTMTTSADLSAVELSSAELHSAVSEAKVRLTSETAAVCHQQISTL
jgi:hypothetical protein